MWAKPIPQKCRATPKAAFFEMSSRQRFLARLFWKEWVDEWRTTKLWRNSWVWTVAHRTCAQEPYGVSKFFGFLRGWIFEAVQFVGLPSYFQWTLIFISNMFQTTKFNLLNVVTSGILSQDQGCAGEFQGKKGRWVGYGWMGSGDMEPPVKGMVIHGWKKRLMLVVPNCWKIVCFFVFFLSFNFSCFSVFFFPPQEFEGGSVWRWNLRQKTSHIILSLFS